MSSRPTRPAGPVSVDTPAALDGMRLDRAVAMLTGVSRAEAAALVRDGRVNVDGRPAANRRLPLHSGSRVVVDVVEADDGSLKPEPDVDLSVVFFDDDVIVVDKQAGLVVHPGAGNSHGTLIGGLLARFPDVAALTTSGLCPADRPGIVHRLDRGTSGLLVVARTEQAYRSLVAQFAARSVHRRYVALVAGHVPEERGVVDAPMARSARTPTRMAVSSKGRPARTGYQVLQRFDEPAPSTLLALTLETGRTHQIRVHMAAIDHPVVGDDRYGRRAGGSITAVARRALQPGRLFLHASQLGFAHPVSGAELRWTSPIPPDLTRLGVPLSGEAEAGES